METTPLDLAALGKTIAESRYSDLMVRGWSCSISCFKMMETSLTPTCDDLDSHESLTTLGYFDGIFSCKIVVYFKYATFFFTTTLNIVIHDVRN